MDIINSLITGIIASAVVTVSLIFLQYFRYWYHLHRKFHNTNFISYWKRFPNDKVQSIQIRVKRNILIFKGIRYSDSNEFEGQFIMNPINLKIGEGFHTHDFLDAFAFPKVIIKDENTFLVDATYVKTKKTEKGIHGEIIPQAFVWRKTVVSKPNTKNLKVTKFQAIIEQ